MTTERDSRDATPNASNAPNAPDAPNNGEADGYIMGRTAAERARLRKQAAMLEPATRRVFERAGLREGMTCLDVGCGAGDVMRLMSEFVGPRGLVVGADCDAASCAETLAELRARGEGRFEFVRCDLASAEEIEGGPFDLVFARLVLIHARDPLALLRKMYSWAKPGGLVVVQDYDLRAVDTQPPLAAWLEMRDILLRTFDAAGIDWRIGAKLPAHFVEAGLGPPDGADVWGLLAPIQELQEVYLNSFASVMPNAVALGITTEERGRELQRTVEQAVASGRYYAAFWALLVGVWKRRPA